VAATTQRMQHCWTKHGNLHTEMTISVCSEDPKRHSLWGPHTLCGSNTLLVWLKQVHVFERGLRAA